MDKKCKEVRDVVDSLMVVGLGFTERGSIEDEDSGFG